jgi:hypothetical protein
VRPTQEITVPTNNRNHASRPVVPEDAERVKVTLMMPKHVVDKVARLATANGFNKTTVIRRAIDLEDLLDGIVKDGGTVLVKARNGDIKEVILR